MCYGCGKNLTHRLPVVNPPSSSSTPSNGQPISAMKQLAHDYYVRGYADGCLDGWLMHSRNPTNYPVMGVFSNEVIYCPPPESIRRGQAEANLNLLWR